MIRLLLLLPYLPWTVILPYLSSGTWSLMGVETDAPVITAETESLNFTNEGGVEGTIRLLKKYLWYVAA